MPPKKNRHLSLSMSQRRKPLSTRYKRYQPNFQHPLPTIPKTFNPNLKRNPSFIPARERQFLTISKEYQRSRTSLTPPNTIKLITMFISPNLKATWVRLIILISCSLKCEGHQTHQESETTTQIEVFSAKIKAGNGNKATIKAEAKPKLNYLQLAPTTQNPSTIHYFHQWPRYKKAKANRISPEQNDSSHQKEKTSLTTMF